MRPAIFFDRDGVINERIKGGYVRSWDEFRFLPTIGEVLKEVKQRGYLAIVITNQRGVGRGLMSEADLLKIHDQLQASLLESHQVQFDDIFYCTDAEDSSLRRKPSPLMLLEAAKKWDIDLKNSWIVGDSKSDIEAGRSAGTSTAFLITKHTDELPEATAILSELTQLLDRI